MAQDEHAPLTQAGMIAQFIPKVHRIQSPTMPLWSNTTLLHLLGRLQELDLDPLQPAPTVQRPRQITTTTRML